MSIYWSGMRSAVEASIINIYVGSSDRFVKLANALDWNALAKIVMKDLESTKAGKWWVGRPLYLRIHLAAFLLKAILYETDRGLENRLRNDASLQLFCGKTIIEGWKTPHHTKISGFRARLTPETQRLLIDSIVQISHKLGFADPSWMDVDSTVQEANISYPSDAQMMLKLAKMGRKVIEFLKEKTENTIPDDLNIDIGAIAKKAKEYFFLAKNKGIETKRDIFKNLHGNVKRQLYPLITELNKIG